MPKSETVEAGGVVHTSGSYGIGYGGITPGAIVAWILIALPIAWGVSKTLESAVKLFQ
jgi:hypothetical protein